MAHSLGSRELSSRLVRTLLLWTRQGKVKGFALSGALRRFWRFRRIDLDAALLELSALRSEGPSVCPAERMDQVKRAARFKTGSVVFDKRRKTWNLLRWEDGKRRSKLIGTLSQYPTKGTAQRAALSLLPSGVQPISIEVETVNALAARYEAERFPSRRSTARVYRFWLHTNVLPEWGTVSGEVQPRPVELWLRSLPLSPKSKSHVRNMVYMLMDFAMWCGAMQVARNPIELVAVKGATKRIRKPRNLTVEQFQQSDQRTIQDDRPDVCLLGFASARVWHCDGLTWTGLSHATNPSAALWSERGRREDGRFCRDAQPLRVNCMHRALSLETENANFPG